MVFIPSGCTKQLQYLNVSANKPFKASIMEQYDEWMEHGEKSYTRYGNMKAASKTTMCDWVVKAWAGIDKELVKKSFVACGQVPGVNLEDVNCLKEGRPCHSALPLAKEMWALKSSEIDFHNVKRKEGDEEEMEDYIEEQVEDEEELMGN